MLEPEQRRLGRKSTDCGDTNGKDMGSRPRDYGFCQSAREGAQWKCSGDEQPGSVSAGHAWSDLIDVPRRYNQSRIREIRRQFRATLPIANIESPAAFPADDVLLLKPLKRPAIEAVCLNRTGNPAFAGG